MNESTNDLVNRFNARFPAIQQATEIAEFISKENDRRLKKYLNAVLDIMDNSYTKESARRKIYDLANRLNIPL